MNPGDFGDELASGQYIAYYETTVSGDLVLFVMKSDGREKRTLGSVKRKSRFSIMLSFGGSQSSRSRMTCRLPCTTSHLQEKLDDSSQYGDS